MSVRQGPKINIRRLQDHSVKLCQETLLRDGGTSCLFRGLFQHTDNSDEFAVALGDNGYVVLCDIIRNGAVARNILQKRTTLLHLLCQRKLQLLVFLLTRHKKKCKRVRRGDHESILKAIQDRRFDVVADFLLSLTEHLCIITDDDNQTPIEKFIITLDETDACLQRWLAVFKKLVTLGQQKDKFFLRGVLKQLAGIKFLQRRCRETGCICESDLIKSLWHLNHDVVEKYSLQDAVRLRNLNLVRLLLHIEFLDLNPFVTDFPVNEAEEWSATGDSVLLYLIKSTSDKERREDRKLFQIVKDLAERVDVNANDTEGVGALFYSALYKLRKTFYFLLDHPKFDPSVKNDRGENLTDLFVWANIDQTNPAALVALRKMMTKTVEPPPFLRLPVSHQSDALSPEIRTRHVSDRDQQSIDVVDSPHLETQRSFQDAITDNFTQLCQDMEPEGKLLDVLIQKRVLPWNKIDAIRSEKSRHDKARRVLTLVLRSGRKGHTAFIEALRMSSQEHLANLIEPTINEELIQRSQTPPPAINDTNSETSTEFTEDPSSSMQDQDSFNWPTAGQYEEYGDRKDLKTSQVIPGAMFLPASEELGYGSLSHEGSGPKSLSRSAGIEDLSTGETPQFIYPTALNTPDGSVQLDPNVGPPYVAGKVGDVRKHDGRGTPDEEGMYQHTASLEEIQEPNSRGTIDSTGPSFIMGAPYVAGQVGDSRRHDRMRTPDEVKMSQVDVVSKRDGRRSPDEERICQHSGSSEEMLQPNNREMPDDNGHSFIMGPPYVVGQVDDVRRHNGRRTPDELRMPHVDDVKKRDGRRTPDEHSGTTDEPKSRETVDNTEPSFIMGPPYVVGEVDEVRRHDGRRTSDEVRTSHHSETSDEMQQSYELHQPFETVLTDWIVYSSHSKSSDNISPPSGFGTPDRMEQPYEVETSYEVDHHYHHGQMNPDILVSQHHYVEQPGGIGITAVLDPPSDSEPSYNIEPPDGFELSTGRQDAVVSV